MGRNSGRRAEPRRAGDRQLIVFLHVVKTGGTSIWTALRGQSWFQDLNVNPLPDMGSVAFAQGHRVTVGDLPPEARLFTVLRWPPAWYLSAYHHHAARLQHLESPVPTYQEWYDSHRGCSVLDIGGTDRMYRWCRRHWGREPFDVLQSAWAVLTTKHLTRDWPVIAAHVHPDAPRKLPTERQAGGPASPEDGFPIDFRASPAEILHVTNRLRQDCRADFELYDLAVQRQRETFPALGALRAHGADSVNEYLIPDHPERMTAKVAVTSFCNGRCQTCPTGFLEGKHGKTMPLDRFRELWAMLCASPRIDKVILNNTGDMYVIPDVEQYFWHIEEHMPERTWVAMQTNGELMDYVPEIHEIVISFNGGDKETYERTTGMSYDLMVRNVKARYASLARIPKLELHVLMCELNIGAEKRILDTWHDFPGRIRVSYKYDNQMHKDRTVAPHRKPGRIFCDYLDQLSIWPDGNVISCAHDFWEKTAGSVGERVHRRGRGRAGQR